MRNAPSRSAPCGAEPDTTIPLRQSATHATRAGCDSRCRSHALNSVEKGFSESEDQVRLADRFLPCAFTLVSEGKSSLWRLTLGVKGKVTGGDFGRAHFPASLTPRTSRLSPPRRASLSSKPKARDNQSRSPDRFA